MGLSQDEIDRMFEQRFIEEQLWLQRLLQADQEGDE